ncbi:MAG: hypothetical protein J6W76_00895, partial [Spirochaetales bacterium]|nr:hypothetical protein [Spirochaetales bacterium]
MKKAFICLYIFTAMLMFSQELPEIQLPNLLLDVEDKRQLVSDFVLDDTVVTPITIDTLDKPDFSQSIKIDLEETLPSRTDTDDKSDPVDAVIKFGYGLNNNILADFSIFVKSINPQISVHYLRQARESMFIDKQDEYYGSSLDDLQAQILYNNNKFSLGSEIGFYQKKHSLQDNSIYGDLTKQVLNVDVGPSLKFNNNNDLRLRVFNSFLFFNTQGKTDAKLFRNDFAYLLQSDLVYSQVLGNNHFITTHAGYDFNYDQAQIR